MCVDKSKYTQEVVDLGYVCTFRLLSTRHCVDVDMQYAHARIESNEGMCVHVDMHARQRLCSYTYRLLSMYTHDDYLR